MVIECVTNRLLHLKCTQCTQIDIVHKYAGLHAMSRLFGYGRVSNNQQCLDIQVAALQAEGVKAHILSVRVSPSHHCHKLK